MNFLHQFVSVISMNASNLLFVKWNIELCLSQLFINLFNGKPAVSDEIRASMCIFVWCRSSSGSQKKTELHTFVINFTTLFLIVGNVINNLNKTSISTEYLRNGITEHKMASQSS